MSDALPPPFSLISSYDRDRLPDGLADATPFDQDQSALLKAGHSLAAAEIACRLLPGRPEFSEEALFASADALVRTHEVLRASVDLTGSAEPLLRIHREISAPVTAHDHRGLSTTDADQELEALLESERTTPFDLLAAPLLRINSVRRPAGEWVLVLALPRVLACTLSLPAALEALLYGVDRASAGGSPAAGRPVVRRASVVAAGRGRLRDRAGRTFWRTLTEQSTPFTLPRAWGDSDSTRGRLVATVDFSDLRGHLGVLAADAGVPEHTVLLTAHLKVLNLLTPDQGCYSHAAFPRALDAPAPERTDRLLHQVVLPVALPKPADTWRGLVAQVAGVTRSLLEHQYAPRGTGVADVQTAHVLFEPRFPHLGTPGAENAAAPFEGTVDLLPAQGFAEPALRTVAWPDRLQLVTAESAVGPGYAATLRDLYRLTLEAMAKDPDGDAHACGLPEEDHRRVLREWAVGEAADYGGKVVVDLLREQAARTPEAPAVRTPVATLNYRELDERSEQLAHHLVELGARPDTLVGVHLRRTTDLMPALLGIWKSGAGYLPLDPSLPAERKRQMLESTGCPLVLTTSTLASHIADLHNGRQVLLDRDAEDIAARPTTPPPVRVTPGDLAYVIYTSGSTGTPKGVMIEHGGLANYLMWTVEAYAAHGTGGAPVFSSISFDLGIPNLFTPLLTGQCVHLLSDPLDIAELGRHLADGGPYSFIKMTPGHLDLLSHQLTAAEIRELAGLAIAAGDSFPASLAARWRELVGPDGTKIATEYGPTEITIGNSGQLIDRPAATELIPLGRPIPNTTMYVLTERLEPTPSGVPGEIYVGGAGVARGYLGRPDLTAERFLRDPHGEDGGRLYRTGDLGRWLPDGSLEFLGRVDNQVKVRGYRVELGEIEAALGRHPQVRDAVVAARRTDQGELRLIGYVIPADGHAVDAAGLRAHLAELLPDYMIPATVLGIDHIPLTPNGKVDTRVLPLSE